MEPTERGNDLLNHAVSEVVLLRIGAQVDEGENSDRGFIGKRKSGLRRFYLVIVAYHACGSRRFPHGSDKTEAFARQCFNQALFLTGIADGSPCGIQARCKCSIGHDAAVPNGVDEVVLANDALSVVDQVSEQVEYLWRDRDYIHPAVQFAPFRVECVLLEEIAQVAIPARGSAPKPPGARE